MKILSSSLQGYTNTQSSTIGWEEMCCSRSTTAQSQQTPILRLSIAAGNPEFYFTTFVDSSFSHGSIGFYGAASGFESYARGFKVTTAGDVSLPGGACDFNYNYGNWNLLGFPAVRHVTGTRYIDFRTGNSSDYSIVNTQMYLSVYSERIDLITLTCV